MAKGNDARLAIRAKLKIPMTLRFEGLGQAELGAVLCALGLHENYRFAWKVGGGKPIGMGSVRVHLEKLHLNSLTQLQTTGRLGKPAGSQLSAQECVEEALASQRISLEALEQLKTILDDSPAEMNKPGPAEAY